MSENIKQWKQSSSIAASNPYRNIDLSDLTPAIDGDVIVFGGLCDSSGAEILPATQTTLAAIDAKVPALGQALAAASVPIVLTAAQLSTLTPPAAITGFATETTLSALNGKITAVNTGAVVLAAGTAAFGKLAANDGVDIGDVTVNNASGASAVNIQDGGNSITVDGTFWQATQPVSIASTLTVTGSGGTFPVTDSGGSLTVDAPVGTPVFVRLSDGSSAISTLPVSLASVPSHAVTNAGTFAVQVDGTALTRLTDIETNTDSGAVVNNGAAATAQRVTIANDSTGILAGVTTVTTVTTCSTVTTCTTLTGSGVSHDSPDSGNPHKLGARATNVDIAAVSANNDRTDLVATLTGKLITHPWSNPENFVSGAITSAMTGTTSTSLISAPASGLRNYITQITVSNSHATVGTDVIIQDGSGGTTLYTIPAAAVYGGAVINFPVPLRQPSTATALYCANVTTGASTKVSASGFKAA